MLLVDIGFLLIKIDLLIGKQVNSNFMPSSVFGLATQKAKKIRSLASLRITGLLILRHQFSCLNDVIIPVFEFLKLTGKFIEH